IVGQATDTGERLGRGGVDPELAKVALARADRRVARGKGGADLMVVVRLVVCAGVQAAAEFPLVLVEGVVSASLLDREGGCARGVDGEKRSKKGKSSGCDAGRLHLRSSPSVMTPGFRHAPRVPVDVDNL